MATALVTGANRGIGLELCRQLAARGDEVIAVCRHASDDLRELGVTVYEGVDVTDGASARKLAAELGGGRIDILINNAGVMTRQSLDDLDFDEMRRQYEINALGPLRVTAALLPLMDRGGKIAIITSRMGSLGDNDSGSHYGYRMSKAAVSMAGVSLARDLVERGIAVVILHPGMVATDLTGGRGIDPEEAAQGLIARIDEVTLETTGQFRHANGEQLPW